jgi:hypothetical protein
MEAQSTLSDLRRVSFHEAQKQTTSLNERWSLTKLQVFCTIAGEWGKANCQPFGSQAQWNHSKEVKTVTLKWVINDI